MPSRDLADVKSIHLFKNVADRHFATLVEAAYLQRFPPHVVLIEECQHPHFLHVVLEGSVELFSRHAGHETSIDVVRPVATFILAAVVGEQPYLASGRTLEASRILMIPGEAVRSVFDQDPAFARAIVRELAQAFRGMIKALKNHKLRTGNERLANWIIRQNLAHGATGRFSLPYDKRTLAARLGMTPESLSRSLGALASHGVAARGRTITIRNLAALTDLAKPSPSIDDPDY